MIIESPLIQESLEEIGQLKETIDTNDLERVKALMSQNPKLHRAPIRHGRVTHKHHVRWPLTWVAECRVPWGRLPPSAWPWRSG